MSTSRPSKSSFFKCTPVIPCKGGRCHRDCLQQHIEVLSAVAQDWKLLSSAHAALRADQELVLKAVSQSGEAVMLAAHHLRTRGQV
eukprot:5683324-Amphidinium_carterae.1